MTSTKTLRKAPRRTGTSARKAPSTESGEVAAKGPGKGLSKVSGKTLKARIPAEHSMLSSEVATAQSQQIGDQTPTQQVGLQFDPHIELFPSGISIQSSVGRPVLILKDRDGIEVLPVWMNPLDAGVALAELSDGSGLTPHAVTRRILGALDLKVDSCVFTDLIGHHQYVQLKFGFAPGAGESEHDEQQLIPPLRLRADEAMSFCLQAKARFFSTKTYMLRCRNLDAELANLEQGLTSGVLANLQSEMEISSKKHPYVL